MTDTKIKIRVTGRGIYGAAGKEIPVGREFSVTEIPAAWANRVAVITDAAPEGATAVTNDGDADKQELIDALAPFGIKAMRGWKIETLQAKLETARKERGETLHALSEEGWTGNADPMTNAQLADELAAVRSVK